MNYDCKHCGGRGTWGTLPHERCAECCGTGDSRACRECGIVDKLNDGSCAMCDSDIPVRAEAAPP